MDGHYDADEAAAIALQTMKAEAEGRADRLSCPTRKAQGLKSLRTFDLMHKDTKFAEGTQSARRHGLWRKNLILDPLFVSSATLRRSGQECLNSFSASVTSSEVRRSTPNASEIWPRTVRVADILCAFDGADMAALKPVRCASSSCVSFLP